MSCCASAAEATSALIKTPEEDEQTLAASSRDLGNGLRQIEFSVPEIHCADCMRIIEKTLGEIGMVENARVNFSSRRVRIAYRPDEGRVSHLPEVLSAIGYRAVLLDPAVSSRTDPVLKRLLLALAVSGFAAGNVMLFSVSIWSGADPQTRDVFHWVSALIAVPAIALSGQVFFRSAFGALRAARLNMDVPISLAIVLALALSFIETLTGGEHTFFDAALALVFFLLIGRTLDHVMREKARSAVHNLARLQPRRALRLNVDGTTEDIGIGEIEPGMTLLVAPRQRLPVDGEVVSGRSEVDMSVVSGESLPEPASPGRTLLAGAINLSGDLVFRATRAAADSYLTRMLEMMEMAEDSRSGYRRIAERAADIYAPTVHLLALATLLGWGLLSGDWQNAIRNAIAVLIITCPCALALAVPIVHVVAAGRLFDAGILMRDGSGLERLADVTRVTFDKTGTLTKGEPVLLGQSYGDSSFLPAAAGLARKSSHPLARALATADTVLDMRDVREMPGQGVEGRAEGHEWRLGRADCCGAAGLSRSSASEVWLSRDGIPVAAFTLADKLRADAVEVVAALRRQFPVTILSGDLPAPVCDVAAALGVEDARPQLKPEDKLHYLNAIAATGERVLMVGDGINDAPALAAAHVSMAPSSAADIGRNAADFIYTGTGLAAVPFAIRLARRAARLVKQNFALAVVYNCVAVPLAVTGQVTPLIATLAMSSSSLLVTLNALRLNFSTTAPASSGRQRAWEAETVSEGAR